MRKLILAALAAVCLVSGAELAGKWKGSVSRDDGGQPTSVYMELRRNGDTITGEIGYTPDETAPISNVKIDGDKFSFEVSTAEVLYKISLAASENALKGEVVANRDGKDMPAVKAEFSRQK
jgi:hypothetical protein